MLQALAKTLFGSANDRTVKKLQPVVEAVNGLDEEMGALDDTTLRARTPWLRERLKKGENLDDLMVDAFATVREAAKRIPTTPWLAMGCGSCALQIGSCGMCNLDV